MSDFEIRLFDFKNGIKGLWVSFSQSKSCNDVEAVSGGERGVRAFQLRLVYNCNSALRQICTIMRSGNCQVDGKRQNT